jgi:hypothetical protein
MYVTICPAICQATTLITDANNEEIIQVCVQGAMKRDQVFVHTILVLG